MNRFSFIRNISKVGSRIRSTHPLRYLSGITLGFLAYNSYHYFDKQSLQMETHILPNELISLNKNDYFDRVLGNEKDFFFFIIHDETEENGRTSTRIAKHLKRIADENGFEGWNVYTINRPLFENLKKIVGQTKDSNILADSGDNFPIEIYLKTPHSQDYVFLPFRANKFFDRHTAKKTLQKMKKLQNLVEYIDDEEDLNAKLSFNLNKINTPTLLLRIDDSDKERSQEIIKSYAKLAVNSIRDRLLKFDSNFIVIRNQKLGDQLGLERNQLYSLKNDAVQAYERYARRDIENDRQLIEIDTQDLSTPKAYLQKYEDSGVDLFSSEGGEDIDEDRWRKERRQIRSFVNFAVPRVVILQGMKQHQLGQLIRKCADNKSKLVLSLYCPSTDPDRSKKLAVFMELYKRYNDQFIFCIVESEAVQELFPHCKADLPCLTLFSFLNQIKDYPTFDKYYPSLVYPYQKYFLNSRSPNNPDPEEVFTAVEVVLEGGGRVDYLNMERENVQELRGAMFEQMVENLKTDLQDCLIQFYDISSESKERSLLTDKLSEDFNKKLKFYRMGDKERHGMLPKFDDFPKMLYISNKHRKMYLLNDKYASSEELLREFIKFAN